MTIELGEDKVFIAIGHSSDPVSVNVRHGVAYSTGSGVCTAPAHGISRSDKAGVSKSGDFGISKAGSHGSAISLEHGISVVGPQLAHSGILLYMVRATLRRATVGLPV